MVSLYRNQVSDIEYQLNLELRDIDEKEIHRRFEIHKLAFNELMNVVKVYKPLLKDIKQEYESLIYHVIKAQRYTQKMEEEMKIAISYPTTIKNYERYCDELKEKLRYLQHSNNQLMEKLRDVQVKCETLPKYMNNENCCDPQHKGIKIKRESRILPNLNLEDLTDLPVMQKLCNKLENQVLRLKHIQNTKYVKKEEEVKLNNELMEKITVHENLQENIKNLFKRKFLLQIVLNQQHQTFSDNQHLLQNRGETIIKSLVSACRTIQQQQKSGNISIEDEIDKFYQISDTEIGSAKESDYIVSCIKNFERLFNLGKYKEASDLAVVVPKGVLRNYSTLLKFKNLSISEILFYYCQQLIQTMTEKQLDANISFECVDSALKEKRIDLVALWISQGRITSTELIAENLASYAESMPDYKNDCLNLTTSIYWDLINKSTCDGNCSDLKARMKYFDSILECHIKSGKIEEAMSMITNKESYPMSARSREQMYKMDDLLLLIQFYPNIELIQRLIMNGYITFSIALKSLLESKSVDIAADLIVKNAPLMNITDMVQQLIESISNGIDTNVWEVMMNSVSEFDKKIIIEVAASYLVQISITNSFRTLQIV